MHAEAYGWISETLTRLPAPRSVLEFGSRNINGSVRGLFQDVVYVGVDQRPGPDVDVVADAVTYRPETPVDLLVCAEVLEHADQAQALVANAVSCVRPGGHLLITCAMPHRRRHSGTDGGPVRWGEYYQNVRPAELEAWLATAGAHVRICETHPQRGDLYVLAEVPA